jgi:hypothetical protein
MAGFSVDGVDTSGSGTKVLVGRLVGSPVTEVSQAGHSDHVRQSGHANQVRHSVQVVKYVWSVSLLCRSVSWLVREIIVV